jgi:hypothetical protein
MPNCKVVAFLTLLCHLEDLERTQRKDLQKHTPPLVLLEKIKKETRLWIITGAKRLDQILPRK